MVAAPLKKEEAAAQVKENEEIFAFKRKKKGSVKDNSGSGEGATAPFIYPKEGAEKLERRGDERKLSFGDNLGSSFSNQRCQRYAN